MTTLSQTALQRFAITDHERKLSVALAALDASLGNNRPFVEKAPEQRAAEFRAYHLEAARRVLTRLRDHRQWLAAHRKMNPFGPPLGFFYRDHLPHRVARTLAEASRHRRLAAGAFA